MGFCVENKGCMEVTTRNLEVVAVRAKVNGTFTRDEFEAMVVETRQAFNRFPREVQDG